MCFTQRMAQPIGTPSGGSTSLSIIGPNQYGALPSSSSSSPMVLSVVTRVVGTLNHPSLAVTDINKDNLIFTIQNKFPCWVDGKEILLDSQGCPILTLRPKGQSKCKVFRGDSKDENDLIFTVKSHSSFKFGAHKLDVYLANNTTQRICDFQLKGTYNGCSCTVYAGDSNSGTIIAKVEDKHPNRMFISSKQSYLVTISPNVDTAFIVSLIKILDNFNYTGA